VDANLLEESENPTPYLPRLIECRRFSEVPLDAQRLRSIDDPNVFGRGGSSKTILWKKCVSCGELRTCGNVPFAARRCRLEDGAFSQQ
jgi:hypothetical protein